jgi:spore coat polysaccharide biosynthesis protein SpsF
MPERRQNVVAIIQARAGSSRLPGKVLLDIAGQTMLSRVVARAGRAKSLSAVAVATTADPADDAVEALCREKGYPVFRGSLYDVLDRYYQAACVFGAETIVRLTADCPMIDPDEIDHTVDEFFRAGVDFAANRLPWGRTVPIGLDTEVCSFSALERAWKEASLPYEREHVMPYLYDQEGRFKVLLVNSTPDYGFYRWTVDTPQDLELVRQVYAAFGGRDTFTYAEALALFAARPDLAQINAQVQHKSFKDVDARAADLPGGPQRPA